MIDQQLFSDTKGINNNHRIILKTFWQQYFPKNTIIISIATFRSVNGKNEHDKKKEKKRKKKWKQEYIKRPKRRMLVINGFYCRTMSNCDSIGDISTVLRCNNIIWSWEWWFWAMEKNGVSFWTRCCWCCEECFHV